MESEGVLVVRGRVEIDMRQPFRSVKEAISLFGEKVLAGEIYATNKLKETQWKVDHKEEEKQVIKSHQSVTKEIYNNNIEEGNNHMSIYLNSLKQELEETKKELKFLKTTTTTKEKHEEEEELNPEIEQLKFVENDTTKFVEATTQTKDEDEEEEEGFVELEKKRSVKFASSPLLTRMLVSKDIAVADDDDDEKEDIDFSSPLFEKKKRRKPLFPLFGRLFSKKNGAQKTKSKSFKE